MMKIFMRLLKKLKGENGSVLVLSAAAMVVMLGMTAMVVDIGALVLEKNRLANACDAAALAAARELPSRIDARQKAEEYLGFNGVSSGEANISFDAGNTRITVEATRVKDLKFARVLGLRQSSVSARSVAAFGAVSSITGIVPFGIPDQALVFGHEYQLKAAAHEAYGPGNYGALALGLRGAKNYENNLKYGYSGTVSVGDWIETEPGNMSGPTEDGVNYRLSRCTHTPRCTIEHYHPGCPRVCIVPVYAPDSLQGRDEVRIVGFAAFLLKEVGGKGNDSYVSGYFLQTVPSDGLKYTIDPNQTDYGLHATRLIE